MDTPPVSIAIEARDLEVSYNGNKVLRGLSLSIKEGETVAVIGRSGCGKSTLMRVLGALKAPDHGDIYLHGQKVIEDGKAMFEEWEIRRKVMMVPQALSLLPHLRARDNIALGLRAINSLFGEEIEFKTNEIASALGIEDVLNQYPEELSGGQAQRVQLARALVLQPDVLLLDEVTSSIDPQTTSEVVQALWQMRELKTGKLQSIIIVTHLLDFAAEFAARILFLHSGIIFEEGPATTFKINVKCPETKMFLDKRITA